MTDILTQALGILALVLFILSYQVKSNKLLFLLQGLGNACFGMQFLRLGSVVGAISSFMMVLRNSMLLKINEWKWVQWKGWIVIICAICLAFTIFTWTSIFGIFAFIATTASTIGFWTNNARTIRACNLFCASPAWLIHNIGVGSIGGTLNEIFTICSVLISIRHFGWKALGENRFGEETDKADAEAVSQDKNE